MNNRNDKVDISVIIPIYNSEEYLRDCIDSIINQNNINIEIICIDDASNDQSKTIIEEYMNEYSNIKLIINSVNSGQAQARNRGLSSAMSKYVYFMDSDDYLKDNDALYRVFSVAEKTNTDCVTFDSEMKYEMGKDDSDNIIERITENIKVGEYTGMDYFKQFVDSSNMYVAVWRQLWRRDFLINNNLYFFDETSPHEDLLFTFMGFVTAKSIYHMDDCIHVYRCREGSSMTGRLTDKRLKAYIHCYKRIINFIESRNDISMSRELMLYVSGIRQMISFVSIGLIKSGIDINNSVSEEIIDNQILMDGYQYLIRWFSPQELEMIENAEDVVIYGAGNAGNNICQMLHALGVEDYRIAVTNPDNIERKKGIISIYDVNNKEAVIILGATKTHHVPMLDTLDELGFDKIVILN